MNWGYFGLWDYPLHPDNQDWGLINITENGVSNWIIRESGIGMQQILNSKGNPISENIILIAMIIFALIIVFLIFYHFIGES